MRNLAVLFIHFIAVLARLLGPGGVRSVVAESLLLKHQLLIVNRSRQRSPNLFALDRIFADWMTLLLRPTRLLRSAIALKPSTLLAVLRKNLLQLKRSAVPASIRGVDRPGSPWLRSHNHVAICACGFWVQSKGCSRISLEDKVPGWSEAVLGYSA
jgi:hypothetical protein